jgi:hypothetical protein
MNFFVQGILGVAGLACIGFGGYVAYTNPSNDAWGWFLFVGFLIMLWLANMVRHNTNTKEEE